MEFAVLIAGNIEQIFAAVIGCDVVFVMADFTRRRTCDQPVHTELFFVASDDNIGYCVDRCVESFCSPVVFEKSVSPVEVNDERHTFWSGYFAAGFFGHFFGLHLRPGGDRILSFPRVGSLPQR